MADQYTEKAVEEQIKTPDVKVYEAAICFARMWGVMETLEPLPNLGFEKVRDIVIALAEEFAKEKGEDLVEFFMGRAEELKNEYSIY